MPMDPIAGTCFVQMDATLPVFYQIASDFLAGNTDSALYSLETNHVNQETRINNATDSISENLATPDSSVNGHRFDLILSDMAPNMSGIRFQDSARSFDQLLAVLHLANSLLKPQTGALLMKQLSGGSEKDAMNVMKETFKTVRVVHPKASRPSSSEYYLLGQAFSP
jgi:23S rRNA U2552 (ribose-2'-O)-methylase RlmE/FtsJ